MNDDRGIIDRGTDTEWRAWLDLQGLNELRETAKKVSTKVSGTKQDLRDAIVRDPIVEFIEDMPASIRSDVLYGEYRDFMKENGYDKPPTKRSFEMKLSSLATKHGIVKRRVEGVEEGQRVSYRVYEKSPLDICQTRGLKGSRAEAKAKAKADAKAEADAKAKADAKAEAEAKKKKVFIPKKVKTDVWNTYIGADINKHRCICCKKTVISNTDFDVGHVTSEACGGTLEIGNLRPICAACNHAMGTRNMVDFVKTYGYFIG